MTKFVIFLVFALIVLENQYEVLSETVCTTLGEAGKEAVKLNEECRVIVIFSKLETEYFFQNHSKMINNGVNTADPLSEFEKLTYTVHDINEITNTNSDSFCIYDAWNMTYKALKEHEINKMNCSKTALSLNLDIVSAALSYWDMSLKLCKEIAIRLRNCTYLDNEPDQIKCLCKETELRENVTAITKEITEKTTVLHSTGEKILIDLTACMEKNANFSSKSENIIKELKECLKNEAIKIDPKNIIFLCLCVFSLFRMI